MTSEFTNIIFCRIINSNDPFTEGFVSDDNNMTLKSYLTTMALTTLMCWFGWGFILFTINPETTNSLGFFLFYLSLFLSLTGTGAITGFLIRFIWLKYELAFRSVKDAFRQSFLFAFLVVAALFLLSKNLFNWLNLLFLIVGLVILEYFLIGHKKI